MKNYKTSKKVLFVHVTKTRKNIDKQSKINGYENYLFTGGVHYWNF